MAVQSASLWIDSLFNFSFQIEDLKKISKKSLSDVKMKIPDIINRLWNVCGQMEV